MFPAHAFSTNLYDTVKRIRYHCSYADALKRPSNQKEVSLDRLNFKT
jgi:hypothetical protein